VNPLTAGLAVVVVVHGRPGRKCSQARMFKQAAEFCARDGRTRSRSTALEEIISQHVCYGESANLRPLR
jgi:hypothetical protein